MVVVINAVWSPVKHVAAIGLLVTNVILKNYLLSQRKSRRKMAPYQQPLFSMILKQRRILAIAVQKIHFYTVSTMESLTRSALCV